MITGVVCSAMNWHDLAAIGTLPTLLRVLASKKTKLTSMVPYPGRFRTCTLIGCAIDRQVRFTIDLHEIARCFLIRQRPGGCVSNCVKRCGIKSIREL